MTKLVQEYLLFQVVYLGSWEEKPNKRICQDMILSFTVRIKGKLGSGLEKHSL